MLDETDGVNEKFPTISDTSKATAYYSEKLL